MKREGATGARLTLPAPLARPAQRPAATTAPSAPPARPGPRQHLLPHPPGSPTGRPAACLRRLSRGRASEGCWAGGGGETPGNTAADRWRAGPLKQSRRSLATLGSMCNVWGRAGRRSLSLPRQLHRGLGVAFRALLRSLQPHHLLRAPPPPQPQKRRRPSRPAPFAVGCGFD